jgi:hypothetical protein
VSGWGRPPGCSAGGAWGAFRRERALASGAGELWATGGPHARHRRDSHTKQLFKALQCFMFDVWDGHLCRVTSDMGLVQQLDDLPWFSGGSMCLHLVGNTRICRSVAVLGSSLLNNPQASWRLLSRPAHQCDGACHRVTIGGPRAHETERQTQYPMRRQSMPAAQVAGNGLLNLLRDRGLAKPNDIFVIQ